MIIGRDSRKFISQLREGLVKYLGCSDDKIKWLRFSEEESEEELKANDITEITLDRRMALYNDAFYGFVLRINFSSEWIDLRTSVKKVDEHYVIKLGNGERKVKENTPEELNELIEHIFSLVKDYLDKDFERFVHGIASKGPLGFSISKNR